MEMLTYYRGHELLSPKQLEYLYKIWGESRYHYIETLPLDSNSGSGLTSVTNMLFTIWNDESFNEREKNIIERIKKGTKRSQSKYADKYTTVESNMLRSLFIDAAYRHNNEITEIEDKINVSFNFPMEEIRRLYGLEYPTVMDNIKDSVDKMFGYGTREYIKYDGVNRKFGDNLSCHRDCDSTYYHYYFKIDWSDCPSLRYGGEKCNEITRLFPFLGKFGHFGGYGNGIGGLQIYIYDYANTENNFQMVMNYLIENNLIKTDFEEVV